MIRDGRYRTTVCSTLYLLSKRYSIIISGSVRSNTNVYVVKKNANSLFLSLSSSGMCPYIVRHVWITRVAHPSEGREGIKGNIFRMVRGFVITEIIEFLENECVCQGGVIHRK